MQQKEGILVGLVMPCIGTFPLKHFIEGNKQLEDEDISSCWMTLKKRGDTGN
jgi:hypothetical protein